jgi:hypothetical protein
MSFNDLAISSSGAQNSGPKDTTDDLQILCRALQKYNSSANLLKQALPVAGRPVQEKSLIDKRVRDCRDNESNVKVQLTIQQKKLDSEPKSSASANQRRLAVSKLQKDFDRVRTSVTTMLTSYEKNLPKVPGTNQGGSMPPQAPTANSPAAWDEHAGMSRVPENNVSNGEHSKVYEPGSGEGVVIKKLQGNEVDLAIAEERERDIRRINEDLRMVNEMFKDVAQLVDEQNPTIEKIAEDTEVAQDRAEAGLEQVKQAANYQPGCLIT